MEKILEDQMLPHVNRKYKSTVFELLYKNKKNLLELYNGLNGTEYTDPDEVEVYTLENAIYMGKKNDVSFILASELNLYEHQSTYNPNIPLRSLFYVAKQLEKYVKNESIYSSTLIKIPTPRFVMFYNGSERQAERKAEVIAMSIFEYNEELEMRKLRQSEYRNGETEGEKRGIEKGERLFAELTSRLLEEARIQELKQAMEDTGYRKRLYQKYGIGTVGEDVSEYYAKKDNNCVNIKL